MENLRVYKSCFNKIRLGSSGDGGYVIADLPDSNKYDVLISCGISDDITFEIAFINKYNTPCLAFDGTINDLPAKNNAITFYKLNIGPDNNDKNTNLHDIIEKYDNIFLKMDIETYEFRWFHSLKEEHIRKFKQIVIEFHFPFTTNNFHNLDVNMPVAYKMDVFKKLAQTHKLIHFHGNNCCGTTVYENIVTPNVFECTYLRNDIQISDELNSDPIPSNLDFKNTGNPEIKLNWYPFVKLT